jgi:cytochrome o ubiquinol oxidase operon protein cyoD
MSENRINYRTYLSGFCLSLALTMAAYLLVWHHIKSQHIAFSHRFLVLGIMILALTQLVVQLVFFLHLSADPKQRWNLIVLVFAAGTVFILIAGSLWIMYNLNYHTPTVPSDQSIIHDEGAQEHVH